MGKSSARVTGLGYAGDAVGHDHSTSEEQASALDAWARGHGLRYDRHGMLPPASELLERGQSQSERSQETADALGSLLGGVSAASVPHRWSENLCSGVLPGGLAGTLAHHAYRKATEHGSVNVAVRHTVVVAPVLEGLAVARDLEGKFKWPVEVRVKRDYGPDHKRIEHGELTWQMPADEDEALVRPVIERVPPTAEFSLRDGMVVAAVEDVVVDPDELNALGHAAAAFAEALRDIAHGQRPIVPGDALPDPRPTPSRQWAEAGADRVGWEGPPAGLEAAAAAYVEAAKQRRRGFGRWREMFQEEDETSVRAKAWGRAAFTREYARSRGMRLEDPDEFRRRFRMPFTGSPDAVMRGRLPGAAEGRIVLGNDRNVPDRAFVNIAIVEAPPQQAQAPFTAAPAGHGWLVVAEWVGQSGRSVDRIDAVAAEAGRLAAVS